MKFKPHVRLKTFNLATTSLRHLNMWFDRIHEINQGLSRGHGNYFSDPAAIGLIDNTVRPCVITPAGYAFLEYRSTLRNNPLRAEYELLKILYFSQHSHSTSVQQFLSTKRDHLASVLGQFSPTPIRHLFLTHPKLFVIAELIASFPGAVERLISLPEADLLGLEALGESGFKNLCSGAGFPSGLKNLCQRISGDYTRSEERRLHYLMSMCLLTIAQELPSHTSLSLVVPRPYCNLLTESDIYHFHNQYTNDINVWFDGVNFQVSSSLALPIGTVVSPVSPLQAVALQPQTAIPSGKGIAPPIHQSRRTRRSSKRSQVTVVFDPILSERAEDLAENTVLRPQYGDQLFRIGHRTGEMIALPDGMVPGADFYVTDASPNPIEFIEIKSVAGPPPFNVAFTRAEFLRTQRCVAAGIPYRLILVDITTAHFYEVTHFAHSLSVLQIGETVQFVIRVVL
jgi:hypothetical protein